VVIDNGYPGKYLGQFDVVISGQCLEHVAMPWLWIKDLAAIAKPGALIWITAPNTWEYHAYPIDCWRVWPDGMRALFRYAGLECLDFFTTGNDTVGIGKQPRFNWQTPESIRSLEPND
jgi:hypothetical protein